MLYFIENLKEYYHCLKTHQYMKSPYFYLTILALFAASCGGSSEETYPEDLDGKRALLKEKQAAMQELSKTVAQLESEIKTLDTNNQGNFAVVTTEKIKKTDFIKYTEVQGSVEADDLVAIASETGGRILELYIKEGQSITKGKLVAKLDLEAIEKQKAELQKQLELANDLFERQKRLWEQEIGSEVQYLQAKNGKERLEKALESLDLQLSKSSVYAPASGVVEVLNLKSGEIAAPGAPIALLLNTSKVKIVADVPETLIRSVRQGEKVNASIPALDWEREVVITSIARTIDKNNRTLKVEAEIQNGNGLIKPNLLATMLIKQYTKKDAVVVSIDLVQQEIGGKHFVYIVQEEGNNKLAKKVYVELGETYKNNVVIEKGLEGNEELVLKGSKSLVENSPIQIASN
jgi:RND family efflux transporter MFP subunit